MYVRLALCISFSYMFHVFSRGVHKFHLINVGNSFTRYHAYIVLCCQMCRWLGVKGLNGTG